MKRLCVIKDRGVVMILGHYWRVHRLFDRIELRRVLPGTKGKYVYKSQIADNMTYGLKCRMWVEEMEEPFAEEAKVIPLRTSFEYSNTTPYGIAGK